MQGTGGQAQGPADEVAAGLQRIITLLQAIEERLAQLAPTDAALGYSEAAKKAGISERKLSEWVNSGRLVEGWHFRRVDGSVRFPPDFARRLFSQRLPSAPPIPAPPTEAAPLRPGKAPIRRLPRPSEGRRKSGMRSSFNLDY